MAKPTAPNSIYRFLRIPVGAAKSVVGPLVAFPFSIASDLQHYWLRYPADNELCRKVAATVPAEHFYSDSPNYLIRDGEYVASTYLPQLTWSSLKDFVQLKLPTASLAGRLQTKQIGVWELKRGGREQAAEAALYDADALAQWTKVAAKCRLSSLRFNIARYVSREANANLNQSHTLVFVIGTPLPPVPCHFLCRFERIFIPAGFHWEPNLDSSLVEQSFGIQNNQWLLWTVDFGWSIISEKQCLPLSRASLRATLRELATSS
jgi:hypothetical protein